MTNLKAVGRRTAPLLLACLALLAWACPCRGQSDRILSFGSRITVHRDGGLFVVETIRIKCMSSLGHQGMVREFPATYVDRLGRDVRLRLRVRDLLLDGAQEPYVLEDAPQSLRLVAGRPGTTLSPGEHTYVLSYEALRQIQHLDHHDALYWPVTGYGWTLLIDQAEAVVELPVLATIKEMNAYTGSRGAQGHDFSISFDPAGNPVFTSTRRIYPGDGMAIHITWPQGFVSRPDIVERTLDSLRDHLFLYLAALCLGIGVLRLRRCPSLRRPGLPWPSPPPASPHSPLSPALLAMAQGQGFGIRTLAAATTALALQGALRVALDPGGLRLAKDVQDPSDDWSPEPHAAPWSGLAAFGRILFREDREQTLDAPRPALARAARSLERAARRDLAARTIQRLKGGMPTLLPASAAITCLGFSAPDPLFGLGLTLCLTTLTLLAPLLLRRFFRSWRAVLSDEPGALGPALAATAAAAPTVAGWIVAAWFFFQGMDLAASALFTAVMLLGLLPPWTMARRMVLRGPEAAAQTQALGQALDHAADSQALSPLLPFALALGVSLGPDTAGMPQPSGSGPFPVSRLVPGIALALGGKPGV